MVRPLDGRRVIDLSVGPVGGCATTVLSDFGAEVIKVERPGGDPFRCLPSWPLWLRGKRSIEIDLEQSAGRDRLAGLARGADVLVTSFSSSRAQRLGADWETLAGLNPSLVHATITGFGPRGPYRDIAGYEGIVAALTGRISVFSGQKPRPGPTFAGLAVASHAAAQGAVQGILASLIQREESGQGVRVETSLAQGTLPYDLGAVLIRQLQAREPERYGGGSGLQMPGLPTLNYQPVQCKDGQWIQLGNLLEHLFLGFLEAVGLLSELVEDERFVGDPATWSPEFVEGVRHRILERMLEREADQWMTIFREHGGVVAEIWTPSTQALNHPDLVGNGDVVELVHPELGEMRQIGVMAQLRETPGQVGQPAPQSGAHTQEIESEPEASPTLLPAGGPSRVSRPLEGITVIEFATIIAGPLGVSMLADLGARVIKVEAIGGDPFRMLGAGPYRGLFAHRMNQGKESICIDLKSREGQEIVSGLVRGANAIVHNFRPGVPEKLGIGYASLREIRPDLVWVSANGYGPDGPGAHRPATHPVAGAAMGGSFVQAGFGMPPNHCVSMEERVEASRQLMRANEANPDPNTAVVIASSILLALLAQRRFGTGQAVYVNMLAANAWANADDMLSYPGKAERPLLDAELRGFSASYRFYPTREGWVFLALVQDREWRAFCRQANREDWVSDIRFETSEARRTNDSELYAEIVALLAQRTAQAWEDEMLAAGVPLVKVDARDPADFVVWDGHSEQNGFGPQVQHPTYGEFRRWGPLVTCDGGMETYGTSPLAGEHTDRVLEELGKSPGEIESLRSSGVVYSESPSDP